jgi:nitrate/nitrite-specific signal transduction histidine kinase
MVSQTVAGPIVRLTKTAESIHQGNLEVSASVESQDEIGKLALAFNDMTFQLRSFITSLEQRVTERTAIAESARAESESARKDLESQMWLAKGQTQLAEAMRGELNTPQLAENVVSQLCQYLDAQAGALYLLHDNELTLAGRYAFTDRPGFDGKIQLGQGLVGQSAADGAVLHLENIPSNTFVISTGLTNITPRQVIAAPFHANKEVVGILEFSALVPFRQEQFELLNRTSESIGVAFRTAQTRQRLAELLEESQQQTEALMAQEEELRAANEELHAQAESLRAVRESRARKEPS